jgi:hypothetical protein
MLLLKPEGTGWISAGSPVSFSCGIKHSGGIFYVVMCCHTGSHISFLPVQTISEQSIYSSFIAIFLI